MQIKRDIYFNLILGKSNVYIKFISHGIIMSFSGWARWDQNISRILQIKKDVCLKSIFGHYPFLKGVTTLMVYTTLVTVLENVILKLLEYHAWCVQDLFDSTKLLNLHFDLLEIRHKVPDLENRASEEWWLCWCGTEHCSFIKQCDQAHFDPIVPDYDLPRFSLKTSHISIVDVAMTVRTLKTHWPTTNQRCIMLHNCSTTLQTEVWSRTSHSAHWFSHVTLFMHFNRQNCRLPEFEIIIYSWITTKV